MAGMISTQTLLEILAVKDAEIERLKREKDEAVEKLKRFEHSPKNPDESSKEMLGGEEYGRKFDEVWTAINELKNQVQKVQGQNQQEYKQLNKMEENPADLDAGVQNSRQFQNIPESNNVDNDPEASRTLKFSFSVPIAHKEEEEIPADGKETAVNSGADLDAELPNESPLQLENNLELNDFPRIREEIENFEPMDSNQDDIQWYDSFQDAFDYSQPLDSPSPKGKRGEKEPGTVDSLTILKRTLTSGPLIGERAEKALENSGKRATDHKKLSHSLIFPKKEDQSPVVQARRRGRLPAISPLQPKTPRQTAPSSNQSGNKRPGSPSKSTAPAKTRRSGRGAV